MLQDQFGRRHNYLRISLTDKCNLRCLYCMPNQHYNWLPNDKLMSPEEIETLARLFVANGVDKIRLTGGEPLARKEFPEILERLAQLPVRLSITTNGILLDKHIDQLHAAGVKDINLSLDTLRPERFKTLTQRTGFEKVMHWMRVLPEQGIHLKVNAVVMHNTNEDELVDFVQLTQEHAIHVRFIEFMPFDGNKWENKKVVTYQDMLNTIGEHHTFEKVQDEKHATAKAYRALGAKGTFAVISTVSEPFCSSCNRLRLTAEGQLRNCLFSKKEQDLLGALRRGEEVLPLVQLAMQQKHWKLGGLPDFDGNNTIAEQLSDRSMIRIGG